MNNLKLKHFNMKQVSLLQRRSRGGGVLYTKCMVLGDRKYGNVI